MADIKFTSYKQLSAMADIVADALDRKDGNKDNKIDGSIWNCYIMRHITDDDAAKYMTKKKSVTKDEIHNILTTKIIAKYQYREDVKQNSQIDKQKTLNKPNVIHKALSGIIGEAEDNISIPEQVYFNMMTPQTRKAFESAPYAKRTQMIKLRLDAAQGDYFDSCFKGIYYKWNESEQKFELQEGVDYVNSIGIYKKSEIKEIKEEDVNKNLQGLNKKQQIKKLKLKETDVENWFKTKPYKHTDGDKKDLFVSDYYLWNTASQTFVLYPDVDWVTQSGKSGAMTLINKHK